MTSQPGATPGQALVEVVIDEGGAVEIVVVNDDMPMLVEAVLATVEAHDLTIGRMDHPVMPVQRDSGGRLEAIDDVPVPAGSPGSSSAASPVIPASTRRNSVRISSRSCPGWATSTTTPPGCGRG